MNRWLWLSCFMIVALTFMPSGYMFYKQITWFEEISNQNLGEVYDSRADEIENGAYEYSSNELISHFRTLADSERLFEGGFQKIIVSLKIWFGVILFSSLANAYFLRRIYVCLKKNA